jgi:uncharacterized protein (TIGR04222 family)
MNPFDLHGPEFLAFYFFYAIVVMVVVRWWRNRAEDGPVPHLDMEDPYFIAYLRGGMPEAMRMAIILLMDRKFLDFNGTTMHTNMKADLSQVTNPIEEGILHYFKSPETSYSVLKEHKNSAMAVQYEQRAIQTGLKPDEEMTSRRWKLFGIGGALLLAVTGYKVHLAIQRERPYAFLVVLSVIAFAIHYFVAINGLTPRGKKLIRDVKNLFGDLKGRRESLHAGSSTKELAWLLAVFGLVSMPKDWFPNPRSIFPRSYAASGTGSSCGSMFDSTCGSSSSCSSSSGSSCSGSSCGSSGCGGGGGCGGCGS